MPARPRPQHGDVAGAAVQLDLVVQVFLLEDGLALGAPPEPAARDVHRCVLRLSRLLSPPHALSGRIVELVAREAAPSVLCTRIPARGSRKRSAPIRCPAG